MKIKTKKQMNLPQLIEHIVETSYECNKYIADNAKSSVYVGSIKGVVVEGTIFPTDTFTVEVEEVVDEDTKLPKSLAIFEHNGKLYSEMYENKNINDILKMDIKVKSSSTKTIHMVNDDGTHTLIWRDGKLIKE